MLNSLFGKEVNGGKVDELVILDGKKILNKWEEEWEVTFFNLILKPLFPFKVSLTNGKF
jgi:hypothetical protein